MTTQNSFQAKCSDELLRCLSIGGDQGVREWGSARAKLVQEAEKANHANPRVIIADCDLTAADLRGWSFDHCYLTRVNLTDANLEDARFDRAILRSCRLVRANLRGAQFMRTSIDGGSLGWSVRIDKRTTLAFTGGGDALSGFDPLFRRRAEEDQRIYDIKQNEYSITRFWYTIINYGRSVWIIGLILITISFFYGICYYIIHLFHPENFSEGKWGLPEFWLMSAQRLLNAPSMIDSKDILVQLIFFSEAVIGYSSLALLAAIILRKLTIIE